MDLSFLEKVKKLAIIAMFSDDDFMDRLVLKGGNAMDLIYKISDRASIDIDLSMPNEFEKESLSMVESRVRTILKETFGAEGLTVFDVTFTERPERIPSDISDFWGGYRIEFKVLQTEVYNEKSNDIEFLRQNASVVGPKNKKKFRIEISKFEYCDGKREEELGGHTIYVYAPTMLVLEKIRAICQQMPEYKRIVRTQTQSPRTRDFFDIYLLMSRFSVDLQGEESRKLLRTVFEIKRVPIGLLRNLRRHKEFYGEGFSSLKDTVKPGRELKDFDFYFEYVVSNFENLTL